MATNKSQADYHKQGIRIPKQLHEHLHQAAKSAGRSYNSELIHRLEESLSGGAIVLPDGIRQTIVERAKKNGWPVESELIHSLVDAISTPEDLTPAPTAQELRQLMNDIAERLAALERLPWSAAARAAFAEATTSPPKPRARKKPAGK